MNSKMSLVLFAFFTLTGISVKAQEKKPTEVQIKVQQDQFQNAYAKQKKSIEAGYEKDRKILEAKKNFAPGQKKIQQDMLKARYEEQKRADLEAFNANMNIIKQRKDTLNKGKKSEVNKAGEIKIKQDKMKEKHEVIKIKSMHHDGKHE